MNTNPVNANRKSLSSSTTWRFKFIIVPVIGVTVIMLNISFIAYMRGQPEFMVYGNLVAVAILFLLFKMTHRIHFVEYDEQFVYVKNYGMEKTFPLHTVKAVNLPYYRKTRDRTYQLEIEQSGRTSKFGFLPIETDNSIGGRPEDPESIKEFVERVRQVKENVN